MGIEQEYLADAKHHLASAAQHISAGMNDDDRFQAVVFAAVGVEKLLKHLLAQINPALILEKMTFASLMVACHMDKVTATDHRLSDLKDTARSKTSVIAFAEAIDHATYVCEGVKTHKGSLHALRGYRDTMLHRFSGEVDARKCDVLLCRDLVTALEAISECLSGDGAAALIGSANYEKLAKLSADTAAIENLREHMTGLLERHRLQWVTVEHDAEKVARASRKTSLEVERSDANKCRCPACGQPAVETLDFDVDWDWDSVDQQPVPVIVGANTIDIECHYCGLHLTGYDEIAYVETQGLTGGGGALP